MTDARRAPTGPPGLPLDRLRGFLDREAPGLLDGPLTGRVVAGGKSNLTYEVGDGTRTVDRASPAARPRARHRARHGARAPRHHAPCATPPCRSRRRMPCATTPTSSARRSTSWSASRARPTASRAQLEPLGAERARADRRAHGRHARRAARRRPGRGRARRLRPPGRLPRAAGAALGAAARRLAQPRPARHRRAARAARRRACRRTATRRSCTATTASTTSSSTRRRRGHGRARLGDGDARRPAHRRRAARGLPAARRACRTASPVSDVSRGARLPHRRRAASSGMPPRSGRDLGHLGVPPRARLLQARGDPRGHPLPLHRRARPSARASTRIGEAIVPTRRPPASPPLEERLSRMDFGFDARTEELRAAAARPSWTSASCRRWPVFDEQRRRAAPTAGRGRTAPVLAGAAAGGPRARACGTSSCPASTAPGLTNLQYAPLAEITGRCHPPRARRRSTAPPPTPATWRCWRSSAPPSRRSGGWSRLLRGEIRSAFAMTEPDVALVRRDQHRAPASSATATTTSSTAASGGSPAR